MWRFVAQSVGALYIYDVRTIEVVEENGRQLSWFFAPRVLGFILLLVGFALLLAFWWPLGLPCLCCVLIGWSLAFVRFPFESSDLGVFMEEVHRGGGWPVSLWLCVCVVAGFVLV